MLGILRKISLMVRMGSNPHRLDGKKYSNFGNSPVNYKMKMM